MITSARKYTINEYIEIMHRRIWFIVVPFILIVIGVSIYVVIAPRQYKSTTLVLVSPQRIPEAFVQATVTSKIEERLQSIAQEVMSRTRLEQIIKDFNLYEDESKHLSKEEVVALMQKNIKVELPNKKEEKSYFTISYIGNNANTVTTIANKLASLFIEENFRLREQQALGTTEFLSSELALAREKLNLQEAAVARYKMRFMGELPEQRDTNIKVLDQLQNQSQRVGESLRAALDRKLFIQKQLTDMESPVSITIQGNTQTQAPATGGSYELQKEALRKSIEDLRTKYTENHPDVVAAKKKLADMEKNSETFNAQASKRDPRYYELKNQMAMNDIEIKRFMDEEHSLKIQINKYMSRIEQTPTREQDMAGLMREYQSTKDRYEKLSQRSQEAMQAENLEKVQKGEQFRIIDPARLPEKPFSPDVPKILLLGLFAGIASGLGLAFVREQMDRSFYDAEDVESYFGLKVLATIPKIEEDVV